MKYWIGSEKAGAARPQPSGPSLRSEPNFNSISRSYVVATHPPVIPVMGSRPLTIPAVPQPTFFSELSI